MYTLHSVNGFQNVTASFTVGKLPQANMWFKISGNQGDFAQPLFNVSSGPILTISPGSGRLGTDVIINGTDFPLTDTRCTFKHNWYDNYGRRMHDSQRRSSWQLYRRQRSAGTIRDCGEWKLGDSGTIIFRVPGRSIITLNPGTAVQEHT